MFSYQPLLLCHVFQPLHHLDSPPLDLFWYFNTEGNHTEPRENCYGFITLWFNQINKLIFIAQRDHFKQLC